MKKALLFVLSLLLLISCASQKPETTPVKVEDNPNRFRTINSQNDRAGSQTVVCHNCQAQFKLSKKREKIIFWAYLSPKIIITHSSSFFSCNH